jgi:preprotein translocase subunit SecD
VPPSAGTLRVGRYFLTLLALFAVLYAIVFWPGHSNTPKLGLDLEGGAQIVIQADANGKTPSKSAMDQARQIITNRVNGLGVSNAEVVIQGGDQIVISVPGKPSDELRTVTQAALLQFRPLLAAATPVTAAAAPASGSGSASPSTSGSTAGSAKSTASPSASATASANASPSPQGRVVPFAAGTPTPTATATTTPTTTTAATAKATTSATAKASATPSSTAATPQNSIFQPTPAGAAPVDQWARISAIAKSAGITFTPPTTATAYTALDQNSSSLLQAAVESWPCDNNTRPLDTLDKPLITCSQDNTQHYLLGPVIVQGKQVKSASAIAPGSQQGQVGWVVSISLNSSGQSAWAKYTAAHNEQIAPGDVANQVANTLDSKVIESSTIQQTITGDTQISGNFTQQSANDLANALKYGALPLNFVTKTNTTVSATLGTDQLRAGLLAGGIGLALVVLYSLIYYRALGLVTIASLAVSGGLTYGMLVLLGAQIDFTVTLAGIAGFIVAVGITADSFVVFFERIKDEVHEGRSSRVAIPRAWERAKKTIISADVVSLLASVILYFFAAGEVKGFAFTLGLSTVLDLVVVFLFTHPIVSLFSRSAAFGSARFTGLDHVRAAGMMPAMAGIPSDTATRPARRTRRPARPQRARPATDDFLDDDAELADAQQEQSDDVAYQDPLLDDASADAAADTPEVAELPTFDDFDESPTSAPPAPAPSKTTPSVAANGSTAAERAAARRARARANNGEGDSK